MLPLGFWKKSTQNLGWTVQNELVMNMRIRYHTLIGKGTKTNVQSLIKIAKTWKNERISALLSLVFSRPSNSFTLKLKNKKDTHLEWLVHSWVNTGKSNINLCDQGFCSFMWIRVNCKSLQKQKTKNGARQEYIY